MNRRSLFRIGAASAIALSRFPDHLIADHVPENVDRRGLSSMDRAPYLVRKALSSSIAGFPTIEPIFAGVFLPGGNSTRLISANGFTSFNTQVQTLAASGYRLACFTAIRNMNATWYYAALQPGRAGYTLFRTGDPGEFQRTFSAKRSGYRLVDFSIIWEQGQLFYTGYWLAVSAPASQSLVWDLSFSSLVTEWTSLSNQGNRMTRIQSFPQQDAAAFSALFETGSGGYVLYSDSLVNFTNDVTSKWAGNSLVGLAYDMVDGNMVGCWRDKVASAQFVWNQDWNALSATANQLAADGLILSAVSAYPNAPDFDDYFAINLAPFVMGYAYAVGKDGQVVANGYGFARGPHETQNANVPFLPDVRINLASISKAVTGIALEVLILKFPQITLDSPFWPLIAGMVPNPDPSVKPVTLRNLATMMSGLPTPSSEGPLFGNLWPYLNTYLAQSLVGTPGITFSYNNENFTILQGVIEQVTGQDYVTWVTRNVLVPAGIDPSIFNATPDTSANATLLYSGPKDPRPGDYFSAIDFVAPGGWISTAQELLKILLALRNSSIIPTGALSEMLTDGIGWFLFSGNYGTYYYKDGALTDSLTPPQTLNTCVVRLAEGYDIALVANTQPPIDVVSICAGAFDSRGLLTSNLSLNPPPAVTAVVSAATYLPKAAPAAYCAIIGSGFTNQAATEWTSSITGAALPTLVGGISVDVNGVPAYVEFISATQVNFLLPADAAAGIANVDLITPTGVMSTTFEIDPIAPGFFCYTLKGVLYPSAVFALGTDLVYVAATGVLPGYNSRPAAAGDIIELYATGCGPTAPTAPDGVLLTTFYPAANLLGFRVTIAGNVAPVLFAGLVSPGLWQLNIQIPSGLIGGDQPLTLSVSNITSQPNVMITLVGG
jgi:uncharacterized protein (TIGR03437 family)